MRHSGLWLFHEVIYSLPQLEIISVLYISFYSNIPVSYFHSLLPSPSESCQPTWSKKHKRFSCWKNFTCFLWKENWKGLDFWESVIFTVALGKGSVFQIRSFELIGQQLLGNQVEGRREWNARGRGVSHRRWEWGGGPARTRAPGRSSQSVRSLSQCAQAQRFTRSCPVRDRSTQGLQ